MAAPLLLGAPAHSRYKPTALYTAPTGVDGMHSDLELGPGGGGELLKGDEGQRKDSSFRTARQAGKRAAARAR